jgi:hypothetical protein
MDRRTLCGACIELEYVPWRKSLMISWPCTILVFMVLFDEALQCVTRRCGASLQVVQPSNDFLSLKLPSPCETPVMAASNSRIVTRTSHLTSPTCQYPVSLCEQCRAAIRVLLIVTACSTSPCHRSGTHHYPWIAKNRLICYKSLCSWFQTFAVFCILYVFFWVIPRRLNFTCRRFGTHCSIFIGK